MLILGDTSLGLCLRSVEVDLGAILANHISSAIMKHTPFVRAQHCEMDPDGEE